MKEEIERATDAEKIICVRGKKRDKKRLSCIRCGRLASVAWGFIGINRLVDIAVLEVVILYRTECLTPKKNDNNDRLRGG